GFSAFGFVGLALAAFGAARVISNDGALSLMRTLTSPPLTNLPNSNSSASDCLIFSRTISLDAPLSLEYLSAQSTSADVSRGQMQSIHGLDIPTRLADL